MGEEKVKKPIFKKWWFWLIVVVVLIIWGSSGDKKDQTAQQTANTQQPAAQQQSSAPKVEDKSIKAGMYKVGTDIPAGEYVLISNASAYFQISKDSSGSMDSIIANDNFSNRSIVTIAAGQYFEFKNCSAYPVAQAPTVDISSNVLNAGMYKVGTDFPAGEYKVEADGSGYFEVSNNSSHSMDAISANDNFQGSKYVTVKDGQYLKLNKAKLHLK